MILIGICFVSIDINVRPYLVKLLIDNTVSSKYNNLLPIVIIYTSFQLLMILVTALREFSITKFLSKFQVTVLSKFIKKINYYSYSFFQQHPSGTILAKAQDIFHLSPEIILKTLFQYITFIISTTITLFLLFKVHVLFSISMVLWIIIFFVITYLGIRKVQPISRSFAESRSKIWGYISDYFTNILNVKCFVGKTLEASRLKEVSEVFTLKAQNQGMFLMKFYSIQGGIIVLYTIVFLAVLVYLHRLNQISPGDFALVFMLNFNLFESIYSVSYQLQGFIIDYSAVSQALKIIELPIEIEDQPKAKKLTIKNGKIEFRNVQFNYKDAEELYSNNSIIIQPGEKIGLVGESGCGKTTFVNLILRLFDVTAGQILIDNQNIKEVTQESLRESISIIPQEPLLFYRTIAENIGYGKLHSTKKQIIEAAKKAQAHEFIKRLPSGYQTEVGERGVKLSGGQRQRIVIARAILKAANVVILDEATSQLDSILEKKIQKALKEVVQDKTSIVIAHRLSTLLDMDRILVFDKGKIVEDGTHQELYNKNGHYKALWKAQTGNTTMNKFYK